MEDYYPYGVHPSLHQSLSAYKSVPAESVFFYQQMLNMQFNADKGLVLSSKSPQINNSENPKIGCFPKFAPILIWFIRIFDLVHSNTKKVRMVNSSRTSEGEGPTCQKVFYGWEVKNFIRFTDQSLRDCVVSKQQLMWSDWIRWNYAEGLKKIHSMKQHPTFY